MKKKISALLAGLLAVSLLVGSASALTFPDVDSGADYATAVEYVSELGLMVGDTDGKFYPDRIVTRAQMATIVCRMLGEVENLSTSNVFSDVPTTHWANADIGKASELGIVNGYGNGKFGPSNPVTYEQAVTMVIRAIGKEDSAVAFGGYPSGHLLVAEANGLLNGIQAKQGQGLSRSSVALLLYNYYNTLNQSATPNDGHTHNYITMTVPGSGHYEQVQVGTKSVTQTAEVKEYQCRNCGAKFNTYDEFLAHKGDDYVNDTFDSTNPCCGSGYICRPSTVVVGVTTEPIYETQWVENTIRVCSICGQEE